MSLKNIIRIVLFIFVVGSVSYLIAKEYGQREQAPKVPSTPSEFAGAAASGEARHDRLPSYAVLYYFHGYKRCVTCRTIEQYIGETMESAFAQDIISGRLEWQAVNVEEPQNRHFINDFSLVSSTAILAEMNDGKVTKSKKLDLVWKLVRDKPSFTEYVTRETQDFLGEAGSR